METLTKTIALVYRCPDPGCDALFLFDELTEGNVPTHKRRNDLREVLDCPGSGKESFPASLPEPRIQKGWSLLG